MKRNLILSLLFFLATALTTAVASAQPPSKVVRLASTALRLDGKNIKLETYAFVNAMPSGIIILKGKRVPIDCSKSGRFIVITTISAADKSLLPSGIEVNRVWVHHDGSWWKGVFNKDETTADEKTIRTVARYCPQKDLRGNEEVKIIIGLSYNGKTYYLLSTQEKLHSAN